MYVSCTVKVGILYKGEKVFVTFNKCDEDMTKKKMKMSKGVVIFEDKDGKWKQAGREIAKREAGIDIGKTRKVFYDNGQATDLTRANVKAIPVKPPQRKKVL